MGSALALATLIALSLDSTQNCTARATSTEQTPNTSLGIHDELRKDHRGHAASATSLSWLPEPPRGSSSHQQPAIWRTTVTATPAVWRTAVTATPAVWRTTVTAT